MTLLSPREDIFALELPEVDTEQPAINSASDWEGNSVKCLARTVLIPNRITSKNKLHVRSVGGRGEANLELVTFGQLCCVNLHLDSFSEVSVVRANRSLLDRCLDILNAESLASIVAENSCEGKAAGGARTATADLSSFEVAEERRAFDCCVIDSSGGRECKTLHSHSGRRHGEEERLEEMHRYYSQ